MSDFRGLVDMEYKGKYYCPISFCDFSADNQEQVKSHIDKEHAGKFLQCPKCKGYMDTTPWVQGFANFLMDDHQKKCEEGHE